MTVRPSAWAVVACRAERGPKSRLAPVLSAEDRTRLALAMFHDVLTACSETSLDGTLAIVDGPTARDVGRSHGAEAVQEDHEGLNDAVALGIEMAASRGAQRFVILPSDVPLVRGEDIESLLAALPIRDPGAVVVADGAGIGTNALGFQPCGVLRPQFGLASCEAHEASARRAGVRVVRISCGRLELDVDLPEDLIALRRAGPGGATGQLLQELSGLVDATGPGSRGVR